MKTSSFLALVAIAILIGGCRTAHVDETTSVPLPPNTLTVHNRTPYSLRVFRNAVPWEAWQHGVDQREAMKYAPTKIAAGATGTLSPASSNQSESVSVLLVASQNWSLGCIVGSTSVGTCTRIVVLGTEHPGAEITIRKRNLRR